MSEVKKIATRESYGNALVELGKNMMTLLCWMQTLQRQQRQESLKKLFRRDTSTVVLRNVT